MRDTLILGGGVTGLATGLASGWPVYEARESPGGICSSYYATKDGAKLLEQPEDGEAYRFEIGGGHWIFGGDPAVVRMIRSITPVESYERRSSVFLPQCNTRIPYPLQNHLAFLDENLRVKALAEMLTSPKGNPSCMAEWLEQSFGTTLLNLFFGPFHELYTAGLWKSIAPQDGYKSPVNVSLVVRGAYERTPPVGYNTSYLYPIEGLGTLAQRLADRCEIHYNKSVAAIDVCRKQIQFQDGSGHNYESLVVTLPLDKTMKMSNLEVDEEPDPSTAVLVLNIGAERGPQCPDDHWIYVPQSKTGFHRVGFYSNVDVSFLPASSRKTNDRVSIYVERAFRAGTRLNPQEIASYQADVVSELKEWGFIGRAEVTDPTWVEVAYTWSRPGSRWRNKALALLDKHDVVMTGRYGRWIFQGIADSIRDGLFVGAALRFPR
jgi:protoporphyrinogen oxidase